MYPNLKLQIFKLGIRQNHIAKSLRIDESVLSKIIHGYREPSEAQRKQLAGFLKVEETWLFERFDGVVESGSPLSGFPAREGNDGLS